MNYTCSYCGRHTTITDPNQHTFWNKIYVQKSTLGETGFSVSAVTCPNKECNNLSLYVELTKARVVYGNWESCGVLKKWKLLPQSEAKVIPDYVPEPIRADYYEACLIRDLSPKASATLSRRCLQGMIRDFFGIAKNTLYEEIAELESKVETNVWESIDSVREIGNIGAHMKKDINIIVDVEPKEAQLLVELIEQLIEDWYVVRENRKIRSQKLKDLADSKRK